MANYLVAFGFRHDSSESQESYSDLIKQCEQLGAKEHGATCSYILRSTLSAEDIKSRLMPFVYNGSPLYVFPLDNPTLDIRIRR
jgi:hypothetical protein